MVARLAERTPAGVVLGARDAAADQARVFDEEEALIAGASETRVAQFRAGRHAAHDALRGLGASIAPVLAGKEREPLFAHDIVGSISHTRSIAVSVVAWRTDVHALGIDIERTRVLDARTAERIASQSELAAAHDAHGGLAIFSIKESIYKALYPHVRKWFGFRAVQVTLHSDALWSAVVQEPLGERWLPGATISGIWAQNDDYLASVAVVWA